jgi:hypothetical protein
MAGRSAVLRVAEVVAIVREWVENHARLLPKFAGAYLWGGITAMAADAPFHLYRDVDVVVVLSDEVPDEESEVFYRDLILEVIWKHIDDHRDVEALLANPSAGPNLATTQLLADPTGIVAPVQQAVAAAYTHRRWVQARVEAEKRMAQDGLANMQAAATPQDRLNAVRDFLGAISGLLAVAQLKRPTTRRTLALLHDMFVEQDRLDLNEAALIVMGSAELSRAEIETLMAQIMIDFDRAVEVYQTPIPYGFAVAAHIKPYYVEGTREMIEAGLHREAMYWVACLDTVYLILANDAPEAEKPMFAAHFDALQSALNNTSAEAWSARVYTATRLAEEAYQMADVLVALQPE